jgi:uncharacterized LabA/DUF88 family protein
MATRYAILLDGGFVTKCLRARFRRFPSPSEILDECNRIASHPELFELSLLRIYFYDAPPSKARVSHPLTGQEIDLGRSTIHAERRRFLDAVEMLPNVALRMGELSVHGWRLRTGALEEVSRSRRSLQEQDVELDIEQKGVDLRIGLDIARLALRRLVEVLVVVTGDSDMVPAFRFARREGLRVVLDHLGSSVKRDLKAHADVVL